MPPASAPAPAAAAGRSSPSPGLPARAVAQRRRDDARTAARQQAAGRQRQAQRTKQLGAARSAAKAASPGGGSFRPYQGIIMIEFIAAELLVAATPIASRKNQPGLSPYVPRDMTKLLAIGLLFFILELTAVAGKGRIGAAVGGLVLLTVGMNEAANIVKVLDIFSPPAAKKKGGGGSSTNGQQLAASNGGQPDKET